MNQHQPNISCYKGLVQGFSDSDWWQGMKTPDLANYLNYNLFLLDPLFVFEHTSVCEGIFYFCSIEYNHIYIITRNWLCDVLKIRLPVWKSFKSQLLCGNSQLRPYRSLVVSDFQSEGRGFEHPRGRLQLQNWNTADLAPILGARKYTQGRVLRTCQIFKPKGSNNYQEKQTWWHAFTCLQARSSEVNGSRSVSLGAQRWC